jgi:hypothetical protein
MGVAFAIMVSHALTMGLELLSSTRVGELCGRAKAQADYSALVSATPLGCYGSTSPPLVHAPSENPGLPDPMIAALLCRDLLGGTALELRCSGLQHMCFCGKVGAFLQLESFSGGLVIHAHCHGGCSGPWRHRIPRCYVRRPWSAGHCPMPCHCQYCGAPCFVLV